MVFHFTLLLHRYSDNKKNLTTENKHKTNTNSAYTTSYNQDPQKIHYANMKLQGLHNILISSVPCPASSLVPSVLVLDSVEIHYADQALARAVDGQAGWFYCYINGGILLGDMKKVFVMFVVFSTMSYLLK